MTTYTVREGVTEPIVMTMYEVATDGTRTAVDLTGWTSPVLHLTSKKDGDEFSFSGVQVAITDAAAGEVTFYQAADDLLYSDRLYSGYMRITNPAGKTVDFPSDERFTIKVLEQN